jgi:hypothetical protein
MNTILLCTLMSAGLMRKTLNNSPKQTITRRRRGGGEYSKTVIANELK